MRSSRSRAVGAGLSVAFAAGLGACSGPDEISLGGRLTPPPDGERFLSLAGSDQNDGSEKHPWKTFAHALPLLAPGWTLQVLASGDGAADNGAYDASTSGTLNVRCADASPTSPAPGATLAPNGAPGKPITVRAFGEHLAFLRGNGHVPPISIDSCHDWTIEGFHVEAQDATDSLAARDTGSVVVLEGANTNITLHRLLALHPNSRKDASVIRVGDGASNVSVEECELYDFHENALEVWRSGPLLARRNYINSRGAAAKDGFGVLLEETHDAFVENNLVEGVAYGFGVVGRSTDAQVTAVPAQPGNNHLLGNVVNGPAVMGFRLDSQCAGANPCDAAHTVFATELANDVAIDVLMGVSDAGSIATHIHELSVIGAARGISLSPEPQNRAISSSSLTTSNTMVTAFQSTAFAVSITGETKWGFDHCDAWGGYASTATYAPDDPAHVTSKLNLDPGLGTCLVYLPSTGSPLKGAGASANDVGANVVYQYDERGQLTTMPLWDASSGTFLSCGAIVTDVNGGATDSCSTVHHRLHVGVAEGCSLPP